MNVTIDSSIFVEACSENAIHSGLCMDLLKMVYQKKSVRIFEPSIMLFEFITAISRSNGEQKNIKIRLDKAIKICEAFISRPNSEFIDITNILWREWYSDKNYNHPHKTQDEIFMFVAVGHKSTLVTLDNQMIVQPKCSVGNCDVCSPYDLIKKIGKVSFIKT